MMVNSLITKIEDHFDDNYVDQHVLLGSIFHALGCRRLLNIIDNKKLLNSYFNYSPDVFRIISNYKPIRLLCFLERVIRLKKYAEKIEREGK